MAPGVKRLRELRGIRRSPESRLARGLRRRVVEHISDLQKLVLGAVERRIILVVVPLIVVEVHIVLRRTGHRNDLYAVDAVLCFSCPATSGPILVAECVRPRRRRVRFSRVHEFLLCEDGVSAVMGSSDFVIGDTCTAAASTTAVVRSAEMIFFIFVFPFSI